VEFSPEGGDIFAVPEKEEYIYGADYRGLMRIEDDYEHEDEEEEDGGVFRGMEVLCCYKPYKTEGFCHQGATKVLQGRYGVL
jgi:hypothetical protein